VSSLYWRDGGATVKTYGSTTTAEGISTIKVTLTTRDPHEQAYLLEQLARLKAEAEAPKRGKARPALASPVLMIEDGRARR
jgi:hypothetical protein